MAGLPVSSRPKFYQLILNNILRAIGHNSWKKNVQNVKNMMKAIVERISHCFAVF